MLCTNCYRKIDDNAKVCPRCNAPVDRSIIRCPECWNKLPAGTKICDKCGSDIERSIKEKEEIRSYRMPTFVDKLKKMSLKLKVITVSLVAVIIIVSVVFSTISSARQKEQLSVLAAEYTLFTDDAINRITEIAKLYEEEVYTKDWITYIESAENLRETHKDEIEEIRKFREPVSHRRNKIKAVDTEAGTLADRVYYCYSNCYGYVIGETGKYPNYLKNYESLVDEYKKAVDELEKYIK